MNIKKYIEYIKEDNGEDDPEPDDGADYISNDNPESYIESKLSIIKNKVESMFGDEPKDTGESEPNDPNIERKIKDKEDNNISFDDLGLNLESSEMSNLTKTHRNLTIKFSDDEHYYSLLFRIDLQQASDKDNDRELKIEDIKRSFVKLKKYKIAGFELLGEITENADIENIDEDYLVNLKIELDQKFGGDSEGLSIEYE